MERRLAGQDLSLPALLSLFPLTCLSVWINHSSASWHERRRHTDDEGLVETQRKGQRGGQVHGDGEGFAKGWEMGRERAEAEAHQTVLVLLGRTIIRVFIVLWTHTGCLC